MATAHSKLGASKASIWLNCPAQPGATRGLERRETVYSREGTAAHALADKCLRETKNPPAYIGQTIEGVIVSKDMAVAVQVYIDHVRGLLYDDETTAWGIEERFSLDPIDAELFGTCDFWAVVGDTLHVRDYKHGKGVAVDVDGNTQLQYYALGALYLAQRAKKRIRHVVMGIVQPRMSTGDGIKTWRTDVGTLIEFGETIRAGVERVRSDNPPFVPGDHCRWCERAATCEALQRHTIDAVFQDQDTKPPPTKADEIGAALNKIPAIKTWIKAVESAAYDMAAAGDTPTGYKLVNKQARRVWKDQDAVVVVARNVFALDDDELFQPRKLITPAQMEKLVGRGDAKEHLSPLVVSESSGLTLVKESDRRPAVTNIDPSMFESQGGDDED